MKVRKGFVSNSSSSSFIIAVAKVKDRDLLAEQFGDKVDVFPAKEIGSWDGNYRDGKLTIESFDYSEVSVNVEPDELVMTYTYYGDEGDHFFDEGCTGDYNYDMDYEEMFNADIRTFMDELSDSNAIESLEWTYGAGRNG